MLSSTELRTFMWGQTLFAFDPETKERAATVTYKSDGTLEAQFESGGTDQGRWGLKDAHYWTRYDAFRDGSTNTFYLQWIGPGTVQAFYADGTRAFIQSQNREVER